MLYVDQFFLSYTYSGPTGLIKLMAGKSCDHKNIFVKSKDFVKNDPEKYIQSPKLSLKNQRLSLSTFNGRHATTSNLMEFVVFAIDIDHCFKDENGDYIRSIDAWYKLWNDAEDAGIKLPIPQFIETGRRLKLLYVLEPFTVPAKGHAKKTFLTMYRRMQEVLCKQINSLSPNWGAEVMGPTKFMRSPGSQNRQYAQTAEGRFTTTTVHDVHVMFADPEWSEKYFDWGELPPKYNFFDLKNLILTEPAKYQGTKKKKKEVRQISFVMSADDMLRERLRKLEQLQQIIPDDLRKRSVFLFWNFARQLDGATDAYAEKMAREFNDRYPVPLKGNRFRNCRPVKEYFYRNETINSFLGYELFSSRKNRLEYFKKRRQKARELQIKQGNTKEQTMCKLASVAKSLRSIGKTIMEISEKLNVSTATVKRYIQMSDFRINAALVPG